MADDQASANNPWIEGSSSVALYVRGARATEVERAETDKAFSDLMGIVTARANACDDPYVVFSGEVCFARYGWLTYPFAVEAFSTFVGGLL